MSRDCFISTAKWIATELRHSIARAGLGYGESKVEVEYARIRDRKTGKVLSWEEANRDETLW
eukprot:COSAG06_NODE_253_length_19061_cov_33.083114_10_plen_62_part_00